MAENKISPFTFVNAVNGAVDISRGDDAVDMKEYNPFLINRNFSMFIDTILIANQINSMPCITPQMQYDYYMSMVRPRKRFAKWPKKETTDNLSTITEYYQVNAKRAAEILHILSEEQVKAIKNRMVMQGG